MLSSREVEVTGETHRAILLRESKRAGSITMISDNYDFYKVNGAAVCLDLTSGWVYL